MKFNLWNRKYLIQKWFECKGGTINSPDKCLPLNITSELKKTSVLNEYDVIFSIVIILLGDDNEIESNYIFLILVT